MLELNNNLVSITDPHEAATGGGARVQFTYGTGGATRDHLTAQQWGTGESATFTYNGPTDVSVQDILGQTRKYTLTEQPKDTFSDRAHIVTIVENGVTTSSTPFGQLPSTVDPAAPPTTSVNRTIAYSYNPEESLDRIAQRRAFHDVRVQEPAARSTGLCPAVDDDDAHRRHADHRDVHLSVRRNRSSFLASVSADGKTIESPRPSRANLTLSMSNDSITTTETYDKFGLLKQTLSSGGTDSSSGGAQTTIQYASEDDPSLHQRSLPTSMDNGGLTTTITYPSP